MLPSPSSSPRPVLAPCTNTLRTPPTKAGPYLPTPPIEKKGKRRNVTEHKLPQKRPKFEVESCSSESEDDDVDDDGDSPMQDLQLSAPQKISPYSLLSRFVSSPTTGCRRLTRMPFHVFVCLCSLLTMSPASTLPILQSFVSSNKSDVYKCQSVGDDTFLTPPYACSYSSGEKYFKFMVLTLTSFLRCQKRRNSTSRCCNRTGNSPCH